MFNVVWTPVAEQQLAAAWLAAVDRSAVTTAAQAADRDLGRDPMAVGESRESDDQRIMFVKPLSINFSVVVDDRTVYVTAVWSIA